MCLNIVLDFVNESGQYVHKTTNAKIEVLNIICSKVFINDKNKCCRVNIILITFSHLQKNMVTKFVTKNNIKY